MSDRIASAVFDNQEEAKRAITELRSAGIDQKCISIVGRHGEQDNMDEADGDGEMNAGGTVKGAIGGAVVGGLLGVAALAIPGVRWRRQARSPRVPSRARRPSARVPVRWQAA